MNTQTWRIKIRRMHASWTVSHTSLAYLTAHSLYTSYQHHGTFMVKSPGTLLSYWSTS